MTHVSSMQMSAACCKFYLTKDQIKRDIRAMFFLLRWISMPGHFAEEIFSCRW
jgi:hypothetical protein